ncbi:hypothetical protein [Rouxiella sp. Mn2063]
MLGKIKDDADKALDFAQQISSNSREGNRMWLNKTKKSPDRDQAISSN